MLYKILRCFLLNLHRCNVFTLDLLDDLHETAAYHIDHRGSGTVTLERQGTQLDVSSKFQRSDFRCRCQRCSVQPYAEHYNAGTDIEIRHGNLESLLTLGP